MWGMSLSVSLSLFILLHSTNVQTSTSAAEEQLVERKPVDAESARLDPHYSTKPLASLVISGLTSDLLFA